MNNFSELWWIFWTKTLIIVIVYLNRRSDVLPGSARAPKPSSYVWGGYFVNLFLDHGVPVFEIFNNLGNLFLSYTFRAS